MKKTVSLLMVVVILATSLTTFARASDYIASYNVAVVPLGSGKVRVAAVVQGTHSKMTKIGFPNITLFEKSGNTVTIVETITAEYNSDAGSHGYYFEYQGVAGRSYYAYASFSASDSTGGDSRSATSVEKKAT